jgi:hypothetical protein
VKEQPIEQGILPEIVPILVPNIALWILDRLLLNPQGAMILYVLAQRRRRAPSPPVVSRVTCAGVPLRTWVYSRGMIRA